MDTQELPLGFGMALAQQPEALRAFAALSTEQQRTVVQRAHAVSSRSEMQALVDELQAT